MHTADGAGATFWSCVSAIIAILFLFGADWAGEKVSSARKSTPAVSTKPDEVVERSRETRP